MTEKKCLASTSRSSRCGFHLIFYRYWYLLALVCGPGKERLGAQVMFYVVEIQYISDSVAILIQGERKGMGLTADCRFTELHRQPEEKVG